MSAMLTRTTEMAIQALLVIARDGHGEPVTPKQLADRLECSQPYLAKTLGQLVKAGVLNSVRGAKGGVLLGRNPHKITLLDIVEACQGLVPGSFCAPDNGVAQPCAYHQAMAEVHGHTVATLSRWTLSDLMHRPARCDTQDPAHRCRMYFGGCNAPSKDTSSRG